MFETEIKPKIIYREINCKSAINKIKNKFGFCNDLNIYRGCLHKCYYCKYKDIFYNVAGNFF